MTYETNRYFPTTRERPALPAPLAARPSLEDFDAMRARIDDTAEHAQPPCSYPERRPRPSEAQPASGEKYGRYEELTLAAGTGGAFVEIGSFSGYPDAIDLVATGGDAFVSLRDSAGREESTLRIIQNVPRETHISRRRVFASNVDDAKAATVRATGKWARWVCADAP